VAADPLIGTRVGNYQIVSQLGEGGMARVYRATHPEIGRDVAVKVLSTEVAAIPDVVRRFRVEAQSVNKIDHPNIIHIFDFGALPDGRPFYLMELLSGESLAHHIRRVGAMPVIDALAVTDAVLDALEVVHRANIVHRDLKPDNVFLARSGERTIVKVLDFGIVKLLDDAQLDKTRTGALLGTPSYMAPEQCEGRQRDIGPRSDLYAVGCMLYQMLSGQLPFDADSLGGLLLQHMTQTPPRLVERIAGVPAPISDVVASCLAKDPGARPASAAALRAQLRPFLAAPHAATLATVVPMYAAATIAAPTAPVPSAPSGARSRAPLALAAIGVIAGAGIAIAFAVHGGNRAAAPDARAIDAARADALRPDAALDAPRPDASAADAAPPPDGPLTLKERLTALDHLCAEGTFTQAECAARRQQILDDFGK
jgi:serine/threonine-protein kinase